ncbi:MAG: hypothetical protein H0V53_15080 [Rubrobacter sp.]|nr:hypothetical protein [Rubrobacter sp.]
MWRASLTGPGPESSTIERRLAVVLLLLACFALYACGGERTREEPPRGAGLSDDEPAPRGRVEQGGAARVVLPEEPACPNPYLARCSGAEGLSGVVLESPLAPAGSSEHRPMLVEAVPSYEDGTLALAPLTVELRLREGVTFSDGEPLTSGDLRWTYEAARDLARSPGEEIHSPYSGFERLSRVETPDPRTARLVFDEPYAPWRELLTAPVLPGHVYGGEDLAVPDLGGSPVGSGPFVLEEREAGVMRFVDNPHYWVDADNPRSRGEEPLPNFTELEISFDGPAGAAEALSTGEADFGVVTPGAREEGPLPGDLLTSPAAPVRVEQLLPDSVSPLLGDRRLREAVFRAVDRSALPGASVGAAPVAQSYLSPEADNYLPAWEGYERDGGRAGEAGPPDEPLRLVYPESPGREEVARAVARDLEEAGFEVEDRGLRPGQFFGQALPDGEFDLALFAGGGEAGNEALIPHLPTGSASALGESLGGSGELRERAQEDLAGEEAVLPLFVWPEEYAWSSRLHGPELGAPVDGLLWNVRDWGFYE